jgi:hypothetical protein
MLDSLANIWNMDDLLKLYAFNLWFITAVKWWAIWVEKWSIAIYEKLLKKEIQKLGEKWYIFVDWVFYKWNNTAKELNQEDFKDFIWVNKKLVYLNSDSYTKPENWRWWKKYNPNNPDPNKRYEILEKYSKETSKWWVWQAIWDKTIWETLENSWLQWWKWVWEWLLKKSWFSDDEVAQFKEWKLKWEKPVEIRAIWEMEKAMEMIYRDFSKIRDNILNKWINDTVILLKSMWINDWEKVKRILNIIKKSTI